LNSRAVFSKLLPVLQSFPCLERYDGRSEGSFEEWIRRHPKELRQGRDIRVVRVGAQQTPHSSDMSSHPAKTNLPATISPQIEEFFSRPGSVVSLAAVEKAWDAGYTIVLPRLCHVEPSLARLSRLVSEQLGLLVSCNVYLTPGGDNSKESKNGRDGEERSAAFVRQGLKVHYDDHCVLVNL
jgi:hypothetical protein